MTYFYGKNRSVRLYTTDIWKGNVKHKKLEKLQM